MAAAGAAPAPRWRVAGGGIHPRSWEHEIVVYHEATASTHLLDAGCGEVLLALQRADRELDAMQLWRALFGGEPSPHDDRALIESLASLVQVGLVVVIEP